MGGSLGRRYAVDDVLSLWPPQGSGDLTTRWLFEGSYGRGCPHDGVSPHTLGTYGPGHGNCRDKMALLDRLANEAPAIADCSLGIVSFCHTYRRV